MKIFLGIAGIFLLSLKEAESFQKSGRQNNLLFALLQILTNWVLHWIFNFLLGNVLEVGKKIDQTCVPLHVEQL